MLADTENVRDRYRRSPRSTDTGGLLSTWPRLRAGRLVTSRREGTSIYYTQPDEHVAALVTNILQHAEHVLYARPPHHQ